MAKPKHETVMVEGRRYIVSRHIPGEELVVITPSGLRKCLPIYIRWMFAGFKFAPINEEYKP